MFYLLDLLRQNLQKRQIKIIIWDIDGTFWRNDILGEAIKQEYINYLAKVLEITPKDMHKLFTQENKNWPCWSRTAEALTGVDERRIILAIDKKINKSHYLEKDERLIDTFKAIKDFRHLILTNSSLQSTRLTLHALGFPQEFRINAGLEFPPFEKIFSVDRIKTFKPKKEAFLTVLKYTHHEPREHLIVGDMPEIDLIPAKDIGMKTCLVWGDHPKVDFCLASIYEMSSVFS